MDATPTRTASRSRLPSWLVDVLITVLLLTSALLPFDVPGRVGPNVAALPWLALASAALLLRRRWPLLALGVNVALFAAASVAGVVSPAFVIAPAISIYHVALTHRRLTTVLLTAATALVLPLLSLLSVPVGLLGPNPFVSAQAIQLAAIIAFAGAFGDGAKSRRATLAAYEERALRAEETRDSEARRRVAEDRLQIARDLHDVIAHQIAAINLHANVASRSLGQRPAEAERSLGIIRHASRTVLTEIGDLLSSLRESADQSAKPTNAGLSDLESLLTEFRDNGLTIEASVTERSWRLSAFADVVAYKVLQEALTNALKHSPDRSCSLAIEAQSDLVITLANARENLRADRNDSERAGGHGIAGMRERLDVVGGSLTIDTSSSQFRMIVHMPLETAVSLETTVPLDTKQDPQ